MKHILLIKNFNDIAQCESIRLAMQDTRVEYEIDFARKCVVVYGNQDMVFIARKVLNDLGFVIM